MAGSSADTAEEMAQAAKDREVYYAKAAECYERAAQIRGKRLAEAAEEHEARQREEEREERHKRKERRKERREGREHEDRADTEAEGEEKPPREEEARPRADEAKHARREERRLSPREPMGPPPNWPRARSVAGPPKPPSYPPPTARQRARSLPGALAAGSADQPPERAMPVPRAQRLAIQARTRSMARTPEELAERPWRAESVAREAGPLAEAWGPPNKAADAAAGGGA